MNHKKKIRKVLPFFSLFLLAGLMSFVLSPVWGWETQDKELAKDWEKMLGYKAPDLVGKIAPDIKVGMVINSTNYKQYPGLQELLPKCLYDRFDPNSYAPLAPIKIAKTDQHVISRGFLEKSLQNEKTCHFGEDGLSLVGYNGGLPFVHPKNGNELVNWSDNSYLGDTFAMRPMRLRLYTRENRPERELRQNLGFLRYAACTDGKANMDPNPQQLHYVSSGVFVYPKDVSGAAYARNRYIPANKSDEFLLYIPSMRRLRRMGGRDTQDPLFGSDLVWDDYNVYWQKLSTTEFPNDYKILPMTEKLVPTFIYYNWPDDRATGGYKDYNIDESGKQVYVNFGSWQRRPLYPLEVTSKDSNYLYSKRIILLDVETGLKLQCEMYDKSGRLWRTWVRDYNLSTTGKGGVMEEIIDIVDHINTHRTVLDFKGEMNPKWMGYEYGDARYLSKMAK